MVQHVHAIRGRNKSVHNQGWEAYTLWPFTVCHCSSCPWPPLPGSPPLLSPALSQCDAAFTYSTSHPGFAMAYRLPYFSKSQKHKANKAVCTQ